MLALPAAPTPAPRRQLLVGTALACAAMIMLVGTMLALWLKLRTAAIKADGRWVPNRIVIPEVPTNVMLIAFLPLCVFAQWAVYAARRNDKSHTAMALGLTALLGLAVVNAQAFVYNRMKLPVAGGLYNSMFYAVTGTFVLLTLLGVGFSAVTAFRYLGGRTADRDVVAAHALYWYSLSAVYAVLWLVVYVTK